MKKVDRAKVADDLSEAIDRREQYAEVKEKILDSIKQAKEMGYTLISEDWGDEKKKCACAMGCVLVSKYAEHPHLLDLGWMQGRSIPELSQELEVDESWIDSFTDGFDGNGTSLEAKLPEVWVIGFEVAKETKPIAYNRLQKSKVK